MPVRFDRIDGGLLDGEEYLELHGDVHPDATEIFADRFRVHRKQPGFVLAQARNGRYLVGYAYGMPLRPSTDWWRRLTAPLPEDITTEQAGRTFALVYLAVRASWRRQGIGGTLHDLILGDRPEERATAKIPPGAAAAQAAFASWGWRKVARTRDSDDVLLSALPRSRASVRA